MLGKSLSAFAEAENWITSAILTGAFAVAGALLLWAAGHLSLWRPMFGGMLLVLLVGAVLYAVLIPVEPMLKLRADDNALGYIVINGAVSWGLSIWWGWTLGGWAGVADGGDPDSLDAILVYASAALCLWLSSSSVGLLFNGVIYVWGSMIAGFIALVTAAIMA